MNNNVLMDDKRLKWLGARFASLSMLVGCVLYILLALLPPLENQLSTFNIVSMSYTFVLASLFSLPFSILGGYALGWLLQKTQMYKHSSIKVLIAGAIIGTVTALVIFMIGGFLGSCLIFDGKCGEDFITLLQGIVQHASFMQALFIAAACGSITAWRLSRVAQQKTA